MKRARGLFCLLLALCLAVLTPAGARAEDGDTKDEYTYTVRIYAGNQGTYQGQPVVELPGCDPHQRIIFNLRDVTLENGSKYYVKGIRESGKDDEAQSAFTVECDADYVIVYGILSNMTSYVINYVDADGNTLAPSETYYGNVGDKPVIAYLYIEGYQPQAYNLTKTLSENAAGNVFTFIYSAESVPESAAQETQSAEETTAAQAPGRTEEESGPEAAETDAGGTDANEGETQGEGAEISIDDEQLPLGPQEQLDLDEIEENMLPLANGDSARGFLTAIAADARLLGVPAGVIAAAGAVIIGVILWFALVYLKKKKKERENDETIVS